MLLGAECERVQVDAAVGGASVREEGLDEVEVGALALREAILAVELELGGDDGVLAPTVHVEGGLGEHEGAGVRDVGLDGNATAAGRGIRRGEVGTGHGVEVGGGSRDNGSDTGGTGGNGVDVGDTKTRSVAGGHVPHLVEEDAGAVERAGVLEKARSINERIVDAVRTACGNGLGTTKCMDGIGEGINRVSVVERLRSKGAVQEGIAVEGRAIVNILIWLDDPNELLDGMVEIELDLV